MRDRPAAALDRLNGGVPRTVEGRTAQGRRCGAREAVAPRRHDRADADRISSGRRPASSTAIVVDRRLLRDARPGDGAVGDVGQQVGGDVSPYAIFNRQLMWAALGLVAMFIVIKVPYHRWRALVIPFAILSAGAMMLPFVPGHRRRDQRRHARGCGSDRSASSRRSS